MQPWVLASSSWGCLGPEQDALGVDRHLLVEGIAQLVLREIGQSHELVEYASVANEDVQLSEDANRLGDGCLVVLQPRYIPVEDSHFFTELTTKLFHAVGHALHDHGACPFLHEPLQDALADARACSGD